LPGVTVEAKALDPVVIPEQEEVSLCLFKHSFMNFSARRSLMDISVNRLK
jgi:hypothetical protein